MVKAWPVGGIAPTDSLHHSARRILRVRMAEYYSWQPIVADERAVEALHAMRISAKRLRYTLELFEDLFGELGAINMQRVKAVQEELGNLHDSDVRIALILTELAALSSQQSLALGDKLFMAPSATHQAIATSALRPPPDDPRRGLIALLGREYSERHEHYENFYALWLQFDAAGMRAELTELSSLRLVGIGEVTVPA